MKIISGNSLFTLPFSVCLLVDRWKRSYLLSLLLYFIFVCICIRLPDIPELHSYLPSLSCVCNRWKHSKACKYWSTQKLSLYICFNIIFNFIYLFMCFIKGIKMKPWLKCSTWKNKIMGKGFNGVVWCFSCQLPICHPPNM